MNTERILKLADHIEKLEFASIGDVNDDYSTNEPWTANEMFYDHNLDVPESTFSMEMWTYECGTPACIAGWALALFSPEAIKLPNGNYDVSNVPGADYDAAGAAAELLGIAVDDGYALFTPEFYVEDEDDWDADYKANEYGNDEFISPRRAANTLRRLAKTGVIDWNGWEE